MSLIGKCFLRQLRVSLHAERSRSLEKRESSSGSTVREAAETFDLQRSAPPIESGRSRRRRADQAIDQSMTQFGNPGGTSGRVKMQKAEQAAGFSDQQVRVWILEDSIRVGSGDLQCRG